MFDTGSSKSDLPDIHSRDKRMASAVGHDRQESTTQRKSTRTVARRGNTHDNSALSDEQRHDAHEDMQCADEDTVARGSATVTLAAVAEKSTRSSSTSATPSSLSAARAVDSEKRDSAVYSSMQ